MNVESNGDGIQVAIELDTSNAVKKYDELIDHIKGKDLRPNIGLDVAFGRDAEAAAKVSKEVEDYKKQLEETAKATNELRKASENARAKALIGSLSFPAKFQMDMAAMAQAAYRHIAPMERNRAFSNDYMRLVGLEEQSKKSAYENKFQNRYLESELSDGTYRKKAQDMLFAERAAKRLQDRQDQLLKQGRLVVREERYGKWGGRVAHAWAENPSLGRAAMGAGAIAGRGAGYAAVAGGGLVASGFSGTVEGERFSREMRILSLELAASFKPLIDGASELARRTRKKLQQMDTKEQDNLMIAGGVVGGGALGAKAGSMFGPKGAAIGSLLGALFGGAVAKSQTEGAKEEERVNRIKEGKYSDESAQRNADLASMPPEKRLAEIERRRAVLLDTLKSNAEEFNKFRGTDKEEEAKKIFGRAAYNIKEEDNALREMEKRTREGKSIEGMTGANADRRQLMITEGTGFASAGSTFFAIQEDMTRTIAAESMKQTEELKDIKEQLKALNR